MRGPDGSCARGSAGAEGGAARLGSLGSAGRAPPGPPPGRPCSSGASPRCKMAVSGVWSLLRSRKCGIALGLKYHLRNGSQIKLSLETEKRWPGGHVPRSHGSLGRGRVQQSGKPQNPKPVGAEGKEAAQARVLLIGNQHRRPSAVFWHNRHPCNKWLWLVYSCWIV